jgi:enamine deaminase RidA (YjgF/YER057c/UK114 family)
VRDAETESRGGAEGAETGRAATPGESGGAAPIHPDGWPRGAGYAHGMAASGRIILTAGQIGWDPVTQRLVSPEFAAQAEQALRNVATVVEAAGARPEDVVRMTWFITDRAAYLAAARDIGIAYRDIFGKHYPAMSVVVVAGLLEEGALVEIEATAIAG